MNASSLPNHTNRLEKVEARACEDNIFALQAGQLEFDPQNTCFKKSQGWVGGAESVQVAATKPYTWVIPGARLVQERTHSRMLRSDFCTCTVAHTSPPT